MSPIPPNATLPYLDPSPRTRHPLVAGRFVYACKDIARNITKAHKKRPPRSKLDTPYAPPSTNPQPIPALARKRTLRRKAHICNLVLAPPARARPLGLHVRPARGSRRRRAVTVQRRLVVGVQQVPGHHEGVVGGGGEEAPLVRGPFDGVERACVAAEFEEGGARLTHVEDADEIAVGGEGGEHV